MTYKRIVLGVTLSLIRGTAWAESLTMTTYYPSPMGVYRQMTTTQGTRLSRDSGNLAVGAFLGGYSIDPAYKLDVDGDLRARNLRAGIVTADDFRLTSGGSIGFWSASGSSIFNNNPGYIGIGLSNPTNPLTIDEMGTGHPLKLLGNNDNRILFGNSVGASQFEAGIRQNAGNGLNTFAVYNPANRLGIVLTDNASLLIGDPTLWPRARLDVEGDAMLSCPNAGLVLRSPDGNTCSKLTIDNAGALVVTVLGACP